SYLLEGAFLPGTPPYLRWTSHVSDVPSSFHAMDIPSFQQFLDGISSRAMFSADVSHAVLLSLGLIGREMTRALFTDPEEAIHSSFQREHFDLWNTKLEVILISIKSHIAPSEQSDSPKPPSDIADAEPSESPNPASLGEAAMAVTPPPESTPPLVFTAFPVAHIEDGEGILFANVPPITGEPGSPAASSGEKSSAIKFIQGLSRLQVYQDAASLMEWASVSHAQTLAHTDGSSLEQNFQAAMGGRNTYYAGNAFPSSSQEMRAMVGEMVDGAKQYGLSKLLNPWLLAFGLLFREISAALDTQAGIPVFPEYPFPSELTQEDMDFATRALNDLLVWSEHPVYVVGEKRRSKATAKAGQSSKSRDDGSKGGETKDNEPTGEALQPGRKKPGPAGVSRKRGKKAQK
ncbi:hypothetical protein HWV62_8253, partial [Athelia sp. TMB]